VPRASGAYVLAAALALAYAALTFRHGFLYDDRQLVLDEPRPASAREIASALLAGHYGTLPYYRPLTRATYLAQKAVHGDVPLPFHAVNAALAGALLLAAYALLRSPRFGIGRGAALAGAALFVVHPVTASCVFPIAGRDTLLPAALMVAAVTLWLRPARGARAGAWALFALALLAKEMAVATPLLFALADATSESAPRRVRDWAARYAPLLPIAAAYAALRHAALSGASSPALRGSLAGPIASVAYGLQSTFAPFLRLAYEPPVPVWLSWPRLGAAVLLAAGTAVWFSKTHRNQVRDLAFWSGWFVIAQLPSANLVRQETGFDERYVALALLGPIGLAAAALSAGAHARRLAPAAGVVLAAAAGITLVRAGAFRTEMDFQSAWVRSNPASANAQNGLGVALAEAGRREEAERAYRAALASDPRHGQAANNLGVLLLDRGGVEADAAFLEIAAADPRYAAARYNLGNARARQGRTQEAEALYREAIALRPGYASAWNNLGGLLQASGRSEDALAAYASAVRADPAHVQARVNRGVLLARLGRYPEAIASYREALALDPENADAWFDIAGAAAASGDLARARDALERALALRPGWRVAEDALAALRARADQSNSVGGGSSVNERR